MKVSYQWLSEYVDVSGYSPQELAEKLTRSGIEVDVVEERNKGVQGVVVGQVVSCEQHPNADKLQVCKVNAGTGEELQIICGASNVAAGQHVPVATVGVVLPGDFKIKKAKLRGVESFGMICSAKELGMNDRLLPKAFQEGILVMPKEANIGTEVTDLLGLNDAVLELELTPNRSDCLSMIGVAYEIAAILGREVNLPQIKADQDAVKDASKELMSVHIKVPEACPHYSARRIEGVHVKPSPLWMQNRLMAAGVRPINNIVDITNYVMLEYGQPLHAFDAEKVEGTQIVVRMAEQGERFTTLDDAQRELQPHMLVIADAHKAIALAGVMGGANTEVNEKTTALVLESARFSGPIVRMTSKELGLRSESSLRFEKEVDPARVLQALNRAADLLVQYAGGRLDGGIAEEDLGQVEAQKIAIDAQKINDYLGTSLDVQEMLVIFQRLQFTVEQTEGTGMLVHVPTRRGDISHEVDLIEEVARLYGYDQVPTTLLHGVTTPGSLSKEQAIRRQLRQLLIGFGLFEAINYSFTHPQQQMKWPGLFADTKLVSLAMPMSEERSVLRTSLIPHLLDMASYNRNRSMERMMAFEIGSVFLTEESRLTKLPEEIPMLGVILSGAKEEAHWSRSGEKVDFYDMKGIAEAIFSYLGVSAVRYLPIQTEGFHPGRTAEIVVQNAQGEELLCGRLGQVHPDVQKNQDLSETYVMEIRLDELYRLANEDITYISLPKYPAIGRDLAVVVDEDVLVGEMVQQIYTSGGEWLVSVEVFDIYTGEHIGADQKSVAFSLVYRDTERTLTDEEVTAQHEQVLQSLQEQFSAALRK